MKSFLPQLCDVLFLLVISLFTSSAGFTNNAFAQSATATLSGTVVDEQGAVIPGVNIIVTDVAKAVQRQVTTNSDGYFTLPQLPPSKYIVRAQHSGFTTQEFKDVVLNVNDNSTLKIR